MTIGPLELLVVRYEGDRVADAIGRELGALEHAHSVRVVDLALVTRAAAAPPQARRVREMTEEELRPFEGATGDLMGLLGDDELDRVAAVAAAGRPSRWSPSSSTPGPPACATPCAAPAACSSWTSCLRRRSWRR